MQAIPVIDFNRLVEVVRNPHMCATTTLVHTHKKSERGENYFLRQGKRERGERKCSKMSEKWKNQVFQTY
jgi:hypothetical protein